jgi:hypothetical protein
MKLVVKSTVGAQKVAKIGSGAVTVRRANAEADNVLVLLLDVNVTQTFAGTVGLVVEVVR